MLLNEIKKREDEVRNLTQEKKQIQDVEKKEINSIYKKSNKKEMIEQELLKKIKDCDNKIKSLNDRIDFLSLVVLELQNRYNKNISKDILKILIDNYEKIKNTPLRYKKFSKLLDNYNFCYLDKNLIYINKFTEKSEISLYISDNGYFDEKYIKPLEKIQNMYDEIVVVNSNEQIKEIEKAVQEIFDFEKEIQKDVDNLKNKFDKKREMLKASKNNMLQFHFYDTFQNQKRYL